MKLKALTDKIHNEKYNFVAKQILGNKSVSIKNVNSSLKSLMVDKLLNQFKLPTIIVVPDLAKGEEWYHDLKLDFPETQISLLIKPERSFKSINDNRDEHIGWLIEGLSKNSEQENHILITSPDVFEIKLPNPDDVNRNYITLNVNDTTEFDTFIKSMMLQGFDRKEYVETQGDIAIRGGIVDLFPFGYDNPVRIEFWGDTIDSIREFNIISQRSIKEHNQITYLAHVFSDYDNEFESSLFKYVKENTLFILDYSEGLNLEESVELKLENFKKININQITKSDITFDSINQPKFGGSLKNLLEELEKLIIQDYQIILMAEGKIHSERLEEMLLNSIRTLVNKNEGSFIWSEEVVNKHIHFSNFSFSKGFISPEFKLACLTEHQIFDRLRPRDKKAKKTMNSITLKELKDLKIGDYVVHEDKGIGKFDGFKQVSMGGSLQDCIRIIFSDEDLLYVSLNYIHKISKYSAQEGSAPILSKLGSVDWAKKKERAKKKLKDIARDLIKLYAKRKAQPGFAFPVDNVWQREFEASFIYEDTPDQSRTTEEVKQDMESSSPMDRLVCGDVGFGKTEVAIRAAFKAAQNGKQVAVLVPTTILAQQHYMSFKDRLSKYPINVDVISRFRTPSAQKKVVENVLEGKTDILIGTHRILSKDIKFKDLGLLIIDEEHRFGVSAKEKLREMRVSVDTLTLTATPIPRTLNFSLMGARDLSVMETPPRNRLPVYTEIIEWNNDELIKIINREVNRRGQVFFVSDKINDLDKVATDLKMLMPTLKFAVAHGQMTANELEDIMEKFIEGKYDVLLATKIIESGIDIPNANTIIINRAQNFGLAELYQLRGRVGRSNHQAYCYLLIPSAKILPFKALQRLQALEEFSDLGSGFHLAMRDMEIRGAGNLLGGEQSGFIIDIGFELFQKILDEAVKELKNEEFFDLFKDKEEEVLPSLQNDDVQIEIDMDALFPNDYIKNETDRFMFYKRLYQSKSISELNELVKEIEDRFGKLPKLAQNLIFVVRVRIAALGTGLTRVIIKQNKMVCDFPSETATDFYEQVFPLLIDYINELSNAQLKQEKNRFFIEIDLDNREKALEYLWKIKKTIEYV